MAVQRTSGNKHEELKYKFFIQWLYKYRILQYFLLFDFKIV